MGQLLNNYYIFKLKFKFMPIFLDSVAIYVDFRLRWYWWFFLVIEIWKQFNAISWIYAEFWNGLVAEQSNLRLS